MLDITPDREKFRRGFPDSVIPSINSIPSSSNSGAKNIQHSAFFLCACILISGSYEPALPLFSVKFCFFWCIFLLYFSFIQNHIKASEPSGLSPPYWSRNPYCISEYNGMRLPHSDDFFPLKASLHLKYNSALSMNAASVFSYLFSSAFRSGKGSCLLYLPDLRLSEAFPHTKQKVVLH